MRDIEPKAQNIESTIEQQKVDEKLKFVANEKKKKIATLTTNIHLFSPNYHQSLSTSPNTDPSVNNDNNDYINYCRNNSAVKNV
jgi:hypothetical protein